MSFRRRRRQLSLDDVNQFAIGFLAIEDLAAAKDYIGSHPTLLTPEYDALLGALAERYRGISEIQAVITDHFRWLLRRCREIGIDAALAERPHLFAYGMSSGDVEAERRLASDLIGQEAVLPSAEEREQLARIPSDLQELLDEATLAMMRHAQRGSLADLDTAIAAWKRMLGQPSLASAPAFVRFGVLNDIGSTLYFRYQMSGRTEDLDRSIEYLQRAVDATPAEFSDRPNYVSNLAVALRERAARTGASG